MTTSEKSPQTAPLIKVTSKESKELERVWRDHKDQVFADSERDPVTKLPTNQRDYDQFIGGPLDGYICNHQPNGPRTRWDKEGYWSDYYFEDTITVMPERLKVKGFHIYATVRGIQMARFEGLGLEDKMKIQSYSGTRGPQHRKLYYWCGFADEITIREDGIDPGEFTGVLQIA